jgi:hypothetical protein
MGLYDIVIKNLYIHQGIFLAGLERITKGFTQVIRSPEQNLKQRTLEHYAGLPQ